MSSWTFTENDLLTRRLECNTSVKKRLGSINKEYTLTASDERCILLYYHQKINDICKYFKYSTSTILSSHLVFARVHIFKPILDTTYDLKHIMLAAVYLASKIDEQHTSVETFSQKIPGTNRKDIEELEYILLDWLDFDISFELPIVPLTGFLLEVYGTAQADQMATILQTIVSMYMTDIPHIFNPALIALAAIKQNSIKTKDTRYSVYLDKLQAHLKSNLSEQIENIVSISFAQSTTVDARYLKEIDSQLAESRKCLNQ